MAEKDAESQVLPPEPVPGAPLHRGHYPHPGWAGFTGFGGEPEPEVSDVGQAEAWTANIKLQYDTYAQALATMQQRLNALQAQADAAAYADRSDARHERLAEESARRRMEAGDNADRRLVNHPARLEAERARDEMRAHRLQWSEMILNQQLTAFQQYNGAALRQAELAQALQAAILTDGLDSARHHRFQNNALASEIVDSIGAKMETWQQNMNATLAKFIDAQALVSQQMQALLGALYGAVPPPGTGARPTEPEA